MTLRAIDLKIDFSAETSDPEENLIAAAGARTQSFLSLRPSVSTLLTSDPRAFCLGLKALRASGILRGSSFCDWGSGIGLICGLAALNGLEAYGIEIESDFVAQAQAMCRDFSLSAEFVCGSFVPSAISEHFAVVGTYGATDWCVAKEINVYDVLGKQGSEMDLIYAYPWPREVSLYEQLFDLTAKTGAVLWLYRQGQSPRIVVKAK